MASRRGLATVVSPSLQPARDCPPDLQGLLSFVDELHQKRSSTWAWKHYKDTIWKLALLTKARRVLEVGGGRWPLFSLEEITQAGVSYVVNDISESELALAPAYFEKVCFDISKPIGEEHQALLGTVDLMFSQMVFEHVSDAVRAYQNVHALLAPGGVCLNFHPVLYSVPFVVNWLLPEALSSRILRLFDPKRRPDEVPKHPARYDLCVIRKSIRNRLSAIGYRHVWQVPFWYHDYFMKIPGVYQLDHAAAAMADRNNWTGFASFSYTLVAK
jgi:SAM-dependent methyltransferase